ncbi:hypothetical protein PCE1_002264 [Barthelona sp. PCE]
MTFYSTAIDHRSGLIGRLACLSGLFYSVVFKYPVRMVIVDLELVIEVMVRSQYTRTREDVMNGVSTMHSQLVKDCVILRSRFSRTGQIFLFEAYRGRMCVPVAEVIDGSMFYGQPDSRLMYLLSRTVNLTNKDLTSMHTPRGFSFGAERLPFIGVRFHRDDQGLFGTRIFSKICNIIDRLILGTELRVYTSSDTHLYIGHSLDANLCNPMRGAKSVKAILDECPKTFYADVIPFAFRLLAVISLFSNTMMHQLNVTVTVFESAMTSHYICGFYDSNMITISDCMCCFGDNEPSLDTVYLHKSALRCALCSDALLQNVDIEYTLDESYVCLRLSSLDGLNCDTAMATDTSSLFGVREMLMHEPESMGCNCLSLLAALCEKRQYPVLKPVLKFDRDVLVRYESLGCVRNMYGRCICTNCTVLNPDSDEVCSGMLQFITPLFNLELFAFVIQFFVFSILVTSILASGLYYSSYCTLAFIVFFLYVSLRLCFIDKLSEVQMRRRMRLLYNMLAVVYCFTAVFWFASGNKKLDSSLQVMCMIIHSMGIYSVKCTALFAYVVPISLVLFLDLFPTGLFGMTFVVFTYYSSLMIATNIDAAIMEKLVAGHNMVSAVAKDIARCFPRGFLVDACAIKAPMRRAVVAVFPVHGFLATLNESQRAEAVVFIYNAIMSAEETGIIRVCFNENIVLAGFFEDHISKSNLTEQGRFERNMSDLQTLLRMERCVSTFYNLLGSFFYTRYGIVQPPLVIDVIPVCMGFFNGTNFSLSSSAFTELKIFGNSSEFKMLEGVFCTDLFRREILSLKSELDVIRAKMGDKNFFEHEKLVFDKDFVFGSDHLPTAPIFELLTEIRCRDQFIYRVINIEMNEDIILSVRNHRVVVELQDEIF